MQLPKLNGKYPVGHAAFTLPAPIPRRVGKSKLLKNGQPALQFEQVAFSVFYPARVPQRNGAPVPPKGVYWLPRPLNEILAGFALFAGIRSWLIWPVIHFFGRFVSVPVHPDAPLLDPVTTVKESGSDSTSPPSWPLVIFSHGLGGSRTAYSHHCSALAAQGYVVLALEHRDGSGPSVRVRPKGSSDQVTIPYIKIDSVTWDEGEKPDGITPLRGEQLEFRSLEIYETFRAFSNLVQTGDAGGLETLAHDSKHDFSQWMGQVNCDDLSLSGHSFGGATALTILSTPPPTSHASLPLSKVLLLDPWLDPLPAPGPTPRTDIPRPEITVINSERFTLWKEHFHRLQEIVTDWKNDSEPDKCASLLTIAQSRHDDFSDFPLLTHFTRSRSNKLHKIIDALALAFIKGDLHAELDSRQDVIRGLEVVEVKGKKIIKGDFGGVVMHV